MRKSTRVENYRMIHTWSDPEHNFVAEVCKEDGQWVVRSAGMVAYVPDYRGAVDIVMDEYRLRKSGHDSWEEAAAEMAEGPWEELSDAERMDLITAARLMARSA